MVGGGPFGSRRRASCCRRARMANDWKKPAKLTLEEDQEIINRTGTGNDQIIPSSQSGCHQSFRICPAAEAEASCSPPTASSPRYTPPSMASPCRRIQEVLKGLLQSFNGQDPAGSVPSPGAIEQQIDQGDTSTLTSAGRSNRNHAALVGDHLRYLKAVSRSPSLR